MRISDWSSDVCSSDLDFERPGEIGPGMVRQSLTKRGIAVVNDICPHRGMTATDLESRKAGATAEEAGKRRCQDDQGERRIQEKDRHKSGHRQPPHDVVLERSEERRVGKGCVSKGRIRGWP